MASNESFEIPESGAVFTFGRSGFADNQQSHFFIRNDPVVEISCGDEHTAVVCQNGRIFLFGHNDYGQLGLGHTRTVTKPSCLKHLKPFHSTHVACGKGHTIVSTDCGRLFSFGSNSDGQLGTGDVSDKLVPEMVNMKNFTGGRIAAVSAGCFHSACLTENGELYVWGSNSDGQCGTDVDANFLVPTKIEFESGISAISCGYYHTVFISKGILYSFGEEDGGKLGYKKVKNTNLPEMIKADFKSSKVVCGGNHTIVLSDEGKVFSCGSNFSGQLGLGTNTAESYSLSPVNFSGEDVKVVEIAAGESHSAFITDGGQLYTCGDGRYGKTCSDNDSTNFSLPTLITLFAQFDCRFVSCGGCQTMVLAKFRGYSFDSENLKTTSLPPLKLNRSLGVNETTIEIAEELNAKIAGEDVKPANLKVPSEESENDDEEKISPNFDSVYIDSNETEIGEEPTEEVEKTTIARDKMESSNGNDPDVVVRKETGLKKLLSVFRKSAARKDDSNKEKETDKIDQVENGERGSRQTSRTCSIV